jgi:photosystem II stability/assembly factor-like uncharacterized protein
LAMKAVLQGLNAFLRKGILVVVALAILTTSCANAYLAGLEKSPWEVISLDTDSTLSDVAFTQDHQHGWIVGSRNTLLETTDGGKTWAENLLELDDQKYTFTSVSFAGDEGWITGIPTLLLHTTDGGSSWSNIPLDPKLPGAPFMVTALSAGTAEMATDIGGIYQTIDGGKTWQALVAGAVGVVRNMTRAEDGRYVAVSSRGNFYSTWEPGQRTWQPHNRENSKRLQNMGFAADGGLWLIARGGQMQFGAPGDTPYEDWQEPINPEFATSWGLLDVAYRTPDELWVSGGGGTLLTSVDQGQTWLKDKTVENVPTNLYRIKFATPDQGFILGQRGYLLRYVG